MFSRHYSTIIYVTVSHAHLHFPPLSMKCYSYPGYDDSHFRQGSVFVTSCKHILHYCWEERGSQGEVKLFIQEFIVLFYQKSDLPIPARQKHVFFQLHFIISRVNGSTVLGFLQNQVQAIFSVNASDRDRNQCLLTAGHPHVCYVTVLHTFYTSEFRQFKFKHIF